MLKVEFDTDNAAFEDLGISEVCSILDHIKEELVSAYSLLDVGDNCGATIHDVNGNAIGQWDFTKEI